MKKVYLMSLMAILTTGAFAQRTIDWAVTRMMAPTEILTTTDSGTFFQVDVYLKNNGPALAEIGDTVAYNIWLTYENNTVITTTGARVRPLFADVKAGDSMRFTTSRFWFPQYPINSGRIKVVFASELWYMNPINPLNRELAATLPNNQITSTIIWWNPNHFGVGIDDFMSDKLLSVYPNPATNQVNIAWNVVNVGSEKTVISVRDMQGRLVMDRVATPLSSFETLDVSSLNEGIYLVEIRNGSFSTTQKLQVTN